MLKRISQIVPFLKLSFYAHHDEHDLIRDHGDVYPVVAIRKCYLFSLVLYTFTDLYGVLGLECESRPSCQIDWSALPSSPYNLYHQMFPNVVWHQINMLGSTVDLFCITSWLGLLLTPPIEKRFFIYPHEARGDKKDELDQMVTFRKRFIKLALTTESVILASGLTFVFGNVLYNSVYNVNVTSAVFWILLAPLHIYHDVLFVYTLPFYVILASKYITIQQATLIAKMEDINDRLSKIENSKNSMKGIVYQRLWFEYLSVNSQMCTVCKSVQEYARFWSPYLTRLLISLICMQCYGFYIFVFVPNAPIMLRLVLFFIVLVLVLDEFMLIRYCAAVVKNFHRFTDQNRSFYHCYRMRPGGKKVLSRNLAKAEILQDSQLMDSYAFRLFGNYRITTQSFHIIISNMTFFFLYIVKNNR